MAYRFETFKNVKRIVVLQLLKVSHPSVIPNRFYKSPNVKNWMCELCMFSQIQSQYTIILYVFACAWLMLSCNNSH